MDVAAQEGCEDAVALLLRPDSLRGCLLRTRLRECRICHLFRPPKHSHVHAVLCPPPAPVPAAVSALFHLDSNLLFQLSWS